jgi:hypothetical protein
VVLELLVNDLLAVQEFTLVVQLTDVAVVVVQHKLVLVDHP